MKKSYIYVIMMFTMIIFTSCVTQDELIIEAEECVIPTFSRDGNTLFANFEGVDSLFRYDWFVDGVFTEADGTSIDGDNQFSLENLEPGTYEICIIYETPDCPTGVTFCQEIVIEEDDDTECLELSFSRDGNTLFASFEGIETIEFYEWSVDGQFAEAEGTNNNGDNQFSLENLEPGTYNICITYETPECPSPSGNAFCQEIVIEEAECLELSFSRDGNTLFANFEGIDTIAFYNWSVDGQFAEADGINNNGDNQFSLENLDPGTYNICITYETPECPNPTDNAFCLEVVIECPEITELIRDENTLFPFFENIQGVDTIEFYEWTVDGIFAEITDNNDGFSIENLTPGNHNICVAYTTPECPNSFDNEFCQEIEIVIECPEVTELLRDGDILFPFFGNIQGVDTIESYEWTVDGIFAEITDVNNGFSIENLVPGVYDICVVYTSPECPNSSDNMFCEVVVIE